MTALLVVGIAEQQPSMAPAHAVRGNTLRVDQPGLSSSSVQRDFRSAGGQRFILKGVADAEQHAFADVAPDGAVTRFYWFQFESLLPAARGSYDYSADSALTLAGLEWRAQVRRYTAPPEPDGDQAALYKLFATRSWRQPLPALRARLVYVPHGDRRQELMIIYAEATPSSAPPTPAESAELITRAQAALRLVRSRFGSSPYAPGTLCEAGWPRSAYLDSASFCAIDRLPALCEVWRPLRSSSGSSPTRPAASASRGGASGVTCGCFCRSSCSSFAVSLLLMPCGSSRIGPSIRGNKSRIRSTRLSFSLWRWGYTRRTDGSF